MLRTLRSSGVKRGGSGFAPQLASTLPGTVFDGLEDHIAVHETTATSAYGGFLRRTRAVFLSEARA
jgi:hypothetical protein